MSQQYEWFALDGGPGNDVCIERKGGRYTWHIHDRRYPDPPFSLRTRRTSRKALEAAQRAMKRYRPPEFS